MRNTTYRELADALFNKIKDYDFLTIDESIAYEIVIKYISPACVKFQSAKQDLNDRDDLLGEFNFQLTHTNFEILVNYMAIEWLSSNYILTGQMLKSRMTSSDFHALNTYQQLGKVIELRDNLMAENDQLGVNMSYRDSDIYDMVANRRKY